MAGTNGTEAPRSIADLFLRRVASTPERTAFLRPSDGGFAPLTWREVGDDVRSLAAGLRALGLEEGQRVGILATTRIEWILADLGILCAGGATTAVYPSSTAEEVAFILQDSEAALVFAEDEAQLAKLRAARPLLPALRQVILLDGEGDGDWAIGLGALRARGRDRRTEQPDEIDRIAARLERASLATLLYTSGTTGRPKGVELTHDCWLYEAEAIDALGLLTPDDVQYLWLPLSHAFGKVLEVAQLAIGFVTAVDGAVERLVANLPKVRPTFVAAVPRIFEKVHARIVTKAEEGGAAKRRLFHWAVDVGRAVSRARRAGQPVPLGLRLQHAVADKLVFAKVRARFGDRLRFFVSGAAPLAPEIAEFFHAAGLLVCEGYGLTETSAASFVNRPDAFKLGSVGLPLPGTEVRIAEDGEVLLRGRGVMRGYHHLPEATAEVLDPDGWFHTGDVGSLDAEGFLTITDRKKDLIKTAGGKYVAPQAVEGHLKASCPYLSQVVVHGDRRKFISVLVTLDREAIHAWARERQLEEDALHRHPEVHALVQEAVDRVNAALAPHERIRAFAVLDRELTQEAGELTASLKLKRKVVEERYRAELDALYAP